MKLPNHVLIIAEAGVNHNGDMKMARRLIDAAVDAGADVVKFQSFRAEALVIRNAPKARYQIKNTKKGGAQWDMLKKLELSPGDHRALFAYARKRRIAIISTPFDDKNADLLERLRVPFYKLPSGEVTNKPLLEHVAAKGISIILSTGMCTLEEVRQAVGWIRSVWNKKKRNPGLVLLHCVSQYPAKPEDCNLRAMATLRNAFRVPVGYSDHTLGIEIPLAAAALGAQIIEKHLTLDNKLPGPDHLASLEPKAFKEMVLGIRNIEKSLGDGVKRPKPNEMEIRRIARRSLVAANPLLKGAPLKRDDLCAKRPGTGIPPEYFETLIGMKPKHPISADTILEWKDFRHA